MILPHVLDYIGYRSLMVSNKLKGHQIHPPESMERYIAEDPHELARVRYPLLPDSLVVDVGGFRGEWAQRIFSQYQCNVDIIEPHPVLASVMSYRFKLNDKITVMNFAVSDYNGTTTLYGNDIYASLYPNQCTEACRVEVRKASDVIKELYPGRKINLLKINAEGSEYKILPNLIDNHLLPMIQNIQVQFHTNMPDYKQKYNEIATELSETHKLAWRYPFLYENWTRKT